MTASRVPLHMQFPEMAKAAKANPSYESFRPNRIHEVQYREMEDRRGMAENRIRRYPNGQLDARYVVDQVIDAMRKLRYNPDDLLPVEAALLTVVLPTKIRRMEPQQAEILTQLSASEKSMIRAAISAHEAELDNWNAGQGGGSTSGRSRTDVGG
jgi:hypothetical protein